MALQTNEVTRLEGPTETPVNDLPIPKLRFVPTDAQIQESPEEFPIDAANDNTKTFETRYSDQEDGLLSTYLHQIGKIPRLTQEEETNLFIKIEKRQLQVDELYQELATYLPDLSLDNLLSSAILNRKIIAESFPQSTEAYLLDLVEHIKLYNAEIDTAKNRIVEANLRLAVCIAKKYRERGLDLLDLVQEAGIGLLQAVGHFDWQRGVKFGAYASWWMQQAIGRSIANYGRTIRLPAYILNEIRKVNRVEASLHQQTNREPSRKEVAEASELTVDRLLLLDQLTANTVSLESYTSSGQGGMEDFVACEKSPNPLAELIRQNLVDQVKIALTELPPREQQIVSLRYGLENGKEHSLQEIGSLLNLSRERIRQLEMRALNRLRHPARCEHFRDFEDL
ncbi:sigma-70 family RNA polymerase sigma factor [Candidatus Poribacteria bacterium]|nr:sigma-70 family RNA polymerase sigma factor [Candidatus Poribacteria bacterium]